MVMDNLTTPQRTKVWTPRSIQEYEAAFKKLLFFRNEKEDKTLYQQIQGLPTE